MSLAREILDQFEGWKMFFSLFLKFPAWFSGTFETVLVSFVLKCCSCHCFLDGSVFQGFVLLLGGDSDSLMSYGCEASLYSLMSFPSAHELAPFQTKW